ncbi:DUF2642 domain-containing protein [Paenibacillus methanolicus]|uniref:Uncharacterized protein DUF2642 n=1 Tax=Paenibacillus methanolicus TaxID=582686 RepID=A0A5S5CI59_9BACL|nr:DUF2642 domain-containing protein [Paenibacillus methanolicus]TYP79479.1 uncharacterized protein DUF2642 [Paenibacillus methanolicus]
MATPEGKERPALSAGELKRYTLQRSEGRAVVGTVVARGISVKAKRRRQRALSWKRALNRLRGQALQWIKDVSDSVESLTKSVSGLTAHAVRAGNEITSLHRRVDALDLEEEAYAARITGELAVIQNRLGVLAREVAALTPRETVIANLLQSRINTAIIIETDAGPVAGTLIEVGVDYVAIAEASGAVVLIPTSQISSFQ